MMKTSQMIESANNPYESPGNHERAKTANARVPRIKWIGLLVAVWVAFAMPIMQLFASKIVSGMPYFDEVINEGFFATLMFSLMSQLPVFLLFMVFALAIAALVQRRSYFICAMTGLTVVHSIVVFVLLALLFGP